MRKEIAKKLKDGVLKYIDIYADRSDRGFSSINCGCDKCNKFTEISDENIYFEKFLTDLIMWAVTHNCKH